MAGLHWEGVASCPPIKNVPTTNIKHLTLIMGGQDATPSQCMLAGRLQKIWTNKELFVYLFVMILAIFWLKRLSSWGVPNLPLTE